MQLMAQSGFVFKVFRGPEIDSLNSYLLIFHVKMYRLYSTVPGPNNEENYLNFPQNRVEITRESLTELHCIVFLTLIAIALHCTEIAMQYQNC